MLDDFVVSTLSCLLQGKSKKTFPLIINRSQTILSNTLVTAPVIQPPEGTLKRVLNSLPGHYLLPVCSLYKPCFPCCSFGVIPVQLPSCCLYCYLISLCIAFVLFFRGLSFQLSTCWVSLLCVSFFGFLDTDFLSQIYLFNKLPHMDSNMSSEESVRFRTLKNGHFCNFRTGLSYLNKENRFVTHCLLLILLIGHGKTEPISGIIRHRARICPE